MQTMIDALYPGSILLDAVSRNADIVAAYIDHGANPGSYTQAVNRFPNKKHIKISVDSTVGAHVLDCEHSTGITPAMCVPWAVNSRRAGIAPTVYCNEESPTWGWINVRRAFDNAHVQQPMYWVANYNGIRTIPEGAVGHQYTDLDANGVNTYDASVMLDNWPQEVDMSLDATDKQFITKTINDALDTWTLAPSVVPPVDGKPQTYVARQALGNIVAFIWGNGLLDSMANNATADKGDIAALKNALLHLPAPDVNEAALAQALVPILAPALAAQLPNVTPAQLETALRNVFRSVPQ